MGKVAMSEWKLPTGYVIRKVPADSVPYGDAVCRRGNHVWAVYDGNGQLVCIGATAKEARERCRRITSDSYGRPPVTYPERLEGRRDKPSRLKPGEEP